MNTRMGIVIASVSMPLLLTSIGHSEPADAPDARSTIEAYRAKAYVERPAEYGKVFFNFAVDCKDSEADVRAAIMDIAGPIYDDLENQIGKNSNSETRRIFYRQVGGIEQPIKNLDSSVGIEELPRIELTSIPPVLDEDTGKVVPGTGRIKRVDVCTGAETKDPQSTMFRGGLRFGVRWDELTKLEEKVRSVNNDDRRNATNKDAVAFDAETIEYSLTEASNKDMLAKFVAQGDAEAKRAIENDREGLSLVDDDYLRREYFAQADFQGNRDTIVRAYPIKRGETPQVEVEVNFTAQIYTDTRDLTEEQAMIAETNDRISSYKVTGKAVGDAEYAKSEIRLATKCHGTPGAAATALQAKVEEVEGKLVGYHQRLHGPTAFTFTDSITKPQPEPPTSHDPYLPSKWDTKKPETLPVTHFLDTCAEGAAGDEVPAPASGSSSDLPQRWQTSLTLTLRSSAFDEIATFVETDLHANYNKAPQKTRNAVSVQIVDPLPAITATTENKLARDAREGAIACLREADGPLELDIKNRDLKCVHFKGLQNLGPVRTRSVNQPRPKVLSSSADHESAGLGTFTRPGDTRPTFFLKGDVALFYRIQSENYAEESN